MNTCAAEIIVHNFRRECGSITPFYRGIWAILFGLAVCSSSAIATPDRQVDVEEQFFGSNETGYVILRTVTDNLGSYYSYHTQRFLDEYSKNADAKANQNDIGERIRTKLLLDVSTHVDPDDPNTKPAKSEVNEKDRTIAMADILEKYPDTITKWDAERFRRLTTDQAGGVFLGSLNIVTGATIRWEVFEERLPDAEWRLVEVMEDSNCIYLKILKGTDGEGHETGIVCIPPRWSRQIHDHLDLKPFYLSAGSYGTKEAALEKARALLEKSNAEGFVGFDPEIWSVWKPDDYIVYVLTAASLKEGSTEKSFTTLQGVLGVDLIPISSEHFREKSIVPKLAPASPTKPAAPKGTKD